MIGSEGRVLLRHYVEQGLTKTAIAERLGINRRTIQRWIEAGELDRDLDADPPRYGPRSQVPTKLDAFKGMITTRVQTYPELSAVRLLEEIRAAGYTGGYTQLKEFVREIRPVETEPLVRFETEPGHQAQVDFADFTLPWGKRYALLVVLGYSRLLWLRFFLRKDMQALLTGLEAAFAFFGGVTRELLFDQMRSVITRDERLDGGKLLHNAEFLRFSAHWSFTPRACRPYRAKTKGKVERPVRYVRESFFYGRDFANDEDLNQQAERWLDRTANVRIHGTTKERPVDRFNRDERVVLQPLALRPYRSLVLVPAAAQKTERVQSVPSIAVEQRPLSTYGRIAGGAR